MSAQHEPVEGERQVDLPPIVDGPQPDDGDLVGTTTHAGYGAGEPRIVVTANSEGPSEREAPVFPLTAEVTRIGSDAGSEIVLAGLRAGHATITHSDEDEYVLDAAGDAGHGSAGEGSPYDDAVHGEVLRNGASFRLGGWTFVFQREEFADHGRPFGGREGGEFSWQHPQPPAPDYSGAHETARSESEPVTPRE